MKKTQWRPAKCRYESETNKRLTDLFNIIWQEFKG